MNQLGLEKGAQMAFYSGSFDVEKFEVTKIF